MKWPFKSITPGMSVIIWDLPTGKVSSSAHMYARYHGVKFTTQTVHDKERKGVKVTRIDGVGATPITEAPNAWPASWTPGSPTVTPRGRHAVVYPFESLAAKESATYTYPEYPLSMLARMRVAAPLRGRKAGCTFATKATYGPVPLTESITGRGVVKLTVTRTS